MLVRMESTIAPGFLVASPHMKDEFFEKTVIFLAEHDTDEGSFGIVLNQATDISLLDIFAQMDIDAAGWTRAGYSGQILLGGPVTPELGWVIHSVDWTSDSTRIFKGIVALTASREILEAIAGGRGPHHYLFCLGYSGWGGGQLDNETRSGAWLNVPLEKELFFDVPLEERWETAILRLGFDPFCLSPTVGGA